MDYFNYKFSNALYSKVKNDRKLSRMFWSSNVGKCSELFDNFFRDKDYDFTKEDWVRYYFDNADKNVLNAIADFIVDNYNYSLLEAKQHVFHRVLGQTWNGMVKEMEVIKEINLELPNISFVKTTHDIDENYFTDWEAYSNNNLLFGIQIKPISYKKMSNPFQLKSKEHHDKQRILYKERFNVPHIIIYYEDNSLYDKDYVLNQINTILSMKINVIF